MQSITQIYHIGEICLKRYRSFVFSIKYVIILLVFITILGIVIFQRNVIVEENHSPVFSNDFTKTVAIINSIRSNASSVLGLRYRAIICTIVRNDPHIVEFLLRNLISGFSHFVLYDNNRISVGFDDNLTDILAPFITAGVLTYVPWYQNTTTLLTNKLKHIGAYECVTKYTAYADWIAYFDTDEYFYHERMNKGVYTLNDLLLEMEHDNICALQVSSTQMYGEAQTLKPNTTLLLSYPRVCQLRRLGKVIANPRHAKFTFPHWVSCKEKDFMVKNFSSSNDSTIGLVHYYSKSIEEYLEKIDKSMPPWIRNPQSS